MSPGAGKENKLCVPRRRRVSWDSGKACMTDTPSGPMSPDERKRGGWPWLLSSPARALHASLSVELASSTVELLQHFRYETVLYKTLRMILDK